MGKQNNSHHSIRINNNDIEYQRGGKAQNDEDDEDEVVVGLFYHQYECCKHEQKKEIQSDNHYHQHTTVTSIILLNLVTIIWGTQHSIVKLVIIDDQDSTTSTSNSSSSITSSSSSSMEEVGGNTSFSSTTDASILLFVRFGLASFIAMIVGCLFCNCFRNRRYWWMDEKRRKEEDDDEVDQWLTWRWSIELGLWMFLGYAFQTIGLQYTTAQKAGFLLYLNVKFVPLFAYILYQRKSSIGTWLSAFIALTGTALLTFDGSTFDFNIGDVWSIAAAAASAMFILRLEFATEVINDTSKLNLYSLVVVSYAALVWCLCNGIMFHMDQSDGMIAVTEDIIFTSMEMIGNKTLEVISKHPLEFLYLGGVTTALANYIQTKAQQGISAERASIIYALDPVYGALFAFAILGEHLTSWGMIGASLITLAAMVNVMFALVFVQKS